MEKSFIDNLAFKIDKLIKRRMNAKDILNKISEDTIIVKEKDPDDFVAKDGMDFIDKIYEQGILLAPKEDYNANYRYDI